MLRRSLEEKAGRKTERGSSLLTKRKFGSFDDWLTYVASFHSSLDTTDRTSSTAHFAARSGEVNDLRSAIKSHIQVFSSRFTYQDQFRVHMQSMHSLNEFAGVNRSVATRSNNNGM
jgi:hypothetical protein